MKKQERLKNFELRTTSHSVIARSRRDEAIYAYEIKIASLALAMTD